MSASRRRSFSRSSSSSRSRSRSRSRSGSRSPSRSPPRRSVEQSCSIDGALNILRSVRPELISVADVKVSCRPETDFLLGDSEREKEVLVVKQSAYITSLLASLSKDIRGEKGNRPLSSSSLLSVPPPISLGHGHGANRESLPSLPPIGKGALKKGYFFRSHKTRLRSSPILEHSSLPQHPLSLSDTCRSVLSRSSGSFKVSITDFWAQEWEELARIGLESASFSETVLNTLSADSKSLGSNDALLRHLSPEENKTLLWSMGRSISSLSDCLARLYMNLVLARRDAHLESASSRIPPDCIPRIRALPLHQDVLFGPQVASTVGHANATAVTDQFLALAKSRPSSASTRPFRNDRKRSAPKSKHSSPKRPRHASSSTRKPFPKKTSNSKGQSKGAGHPQ